MSIGVRFNFPSSPSSSSSFLDGVLSPAVWKLSELDSDGLRLASGLEGVRIPVLWPFWSESSSLLLSVLQRLPLLLLLLLMLLLLSLSELLSSLLLLLDDRDRDREVVFLCPFMVIVWLFILVCIYLCLLLSCFRLGALSSRMEWAGDSKVL